MDEIADVFVLSLTDLRHERYWYIFFLRRRWSLLKSLLQVVPSFSSIVEQSRHTEKNVVVNGIDVNDG